MNGGEGRGHEVIEDTVQGLVPSSGNGLKIPLDFSQVLDTSCCFFFFLIHYLSMDFFLKNEPKS